jgi:hypothetical protein
MAELQDIFEEYGESYSVTHKLPPNYYKAVHCIKSCRTSAMGEHVAECDDCGYTRILYNSCRNRYSPKCQTLSKERWIEDSLSNTF